MSQTGKPFKPFLGCIADDFTGATDLANNLVRSGFRTVQTIGLPSHKAEAIQADAIVVALKSRTISPADAVEQSLAALRWLQSQGVQQIYFKYCSTFDSTPAGNIGPVAEALLDALYGDGKGFTIACPAFPENQRSVFKGYLFVGDQLLSESGMRNHPLTPMHDSNLVRVLQAQTKRRVGLVSYEVVAKGATAIRERFLALKNEGIQIAVVDAVSNNDLHSIAAASVDLRLITAGSGVAIGLTHNSVRSDTLPAATGTRAIVSGSCSQATNAQVLDFKQKSLPSFSVDPLALASGEDVVTKALDWALPLLSNTSNHPILIYATAEPESVKAVQAQLGVQRAGEMVEQALSKIALGLVESGVRQLIVAGGETSGAVVQALGVNQMMIGPQIDPGVPWTTAQSFACPNENLHFALKSGNFGSIDFFTKAFVQLEKP